MLLISMLHILRVIMVTLTLIKLQQTKLYYAIVHIKSEYI